MKFFRILFFSILGLTVFGLGVSGDQTFFSHWYPSTVKSIDPDIAQELISTQDVLILDVREGREFNMSHLQNALPFESKSLENISKQQPILLYCTVGYRSALAAEDLQKQGFQNVYNMNGGLIYWKNSNQKVYDLSDQETDSIHVFNNFYSLWLRNGISSL